MKYVLCILLGVSFSFIQPRYTISAWCLVIAFMIVAISIAIDMFKELN